MQIGTRDNVQMVMRLKRKIQNQSIRQHIYRNINEETGLPNSRFTSENTIKHSKITLEF